MGRPLQRGSTSRYAHRSRSALQRLIESSQCTVCVPTEKIRAASFMHSFGSVGDAFHSAGMNSFWSSVQNELPVHDCDFMPHQVAECDIRIHGSVPRPKTSALPARLCPTCKIRNQGHPDNCLIQQTWFKQGVEQVRISARTN